MPDRATTSLAALARHHDMALETRKRDGTWITTPVNPLVQGDHVFFRTWHTSGKAKRLRNFADVRFAPSTARGVRRVRGFEVAPACSTARTPRTPLTSSIGATHFFRG
jgi:PPOX class probable F420-dependent enzyme